MQVFLSVKEVCRRIGVHRETLRRWEVAGWFPQRVWLTQHRRGRKAYLATDVPAFIDKRAASRDSPAHAL